MIRIAIVGASMNSGKTTAGASLAHGLRRAGYRVGAIKATGTGAFGDYNAYLDAGADHVTDFVDAGLCSTYLEPIPRIVDGVELLLGHAAADGCDVALIEFADGIFQSETEALLRHEPFSSSFHGYLFAAPCSASAAGGCTVLRSMDIAPAMVTGIVSNSPLATREAEAATGIEVTKTETLRDPAIAGALLAKVTGQRLHCTAVPDVKKEGRAA